LRSTSLVFLAFLGACSSGSGDDTITITHDVCAPITVTSTSPTELQVAGIDAALDLWRAHGVRSLTREDEAPIEIRFEPAAGAFRGLYDDETAVVFVNSSIIDPQILSIVIAHELGHAFGLPHVTEYPSVMAPGNITTPPTDADQRALEALWGICP
jgi:hypothetical protein